jgi:membrane protease subunit (stomatin/prohibitin family)
VLVAIIDLVKWDGDPNTLAWKFPSEELATWSQLVVNETQEAFVVHGGVYDGPFAGGRYTLDTENLPMLRGILGLPFGKKSPFTAEAWFVNKTVNLALMWGTPDPIQLQDPKYDIMVPVRAFGQFGVQVNDSKKLLLKLVGTLKKFDTDTLKTYFGGVLTTRIKQAIASAIIERKISVLETSAHLEELSASIFADLKNDLDEYGVTLSQFNIQSINVPEDDPAVRALKSALAKKAEFGILGTNYQQTRSFDVLDAAASNEGSSGNIMGAGMGLGMGAGLGAQMGQQMGSVANALNTQPSAASDFDEQVRRLKELGALKESGILTEDEFSAKKAEILGGK